VAALRIATPSDIVAVVFCNYVVFGVLTVHGIKTAYRLRHGQTRFHENYKEVPETLTNTKED